MGELCASRGGWSDLPIDLLINVLHLLELPEALAVRAVCPSWRSASTAAAGFPQTRKTPWLVSLVTDSHHKEEESPGPPSVSSKFHRLLDDKAYQVKLARGGEAIALCGASHGWLVVVDELSNLVLYDPFAMTMIPLPPITTFSKCIKAVYEDEHEKVIKGYRYLFCANNDRVQNVVSTGEDFYDKVVLSGSPSAGDSTVAMVVHVQGTRLSFARVGGSLWQEVSKIQRRGDSFADIVHHRGRFYAVTMKGMIVSLSYCGRPKPKRETIIFGDNYNPSYVVARYLVSAPWGHLLQVRVMLNRYRDARVEIDMLDLKSRRMVELTPTEALRGHAVFLGQNSPGFLSADEFPELRPDCIYFTTPRLKNDRIFPTSYNQWSGVKVYNLKRRTLETAFPSGGGYYRPTRPLEVWFTPSLSPHRTFSVPLASL